MHLAQGANITVHCNTNMAPLHALMEKWGKDRVHCVTADLYNEELVEKLFFWSEVQFGPIQVLVLNHGISSTGDIPVAEMTLDQWNGTLQTNLTSSFLVCREYLKCLREPKVTQELKEKASIVLIGSTAGKYGEAGNADYAASKSGAYNNIS
jgi:NAD(P)-dependent dehydrogenase (short-subunit alcohol dehydrogenase family)